MPGAKREERTPGFAASIACRSDPSPYTATQAEEKVSILDTL